MAMDLVEIPSRHDMCLSCRMIIAQASYLTMNATGDIRFFDCHVNFGLQTLASSVSSVQTTNQLSLPNARELDHRGTSVCFRSHRTSDI